MKIESWHTIPRYKGLYEVSQCGLIKSLPRKKIVKRVGEYITDEKILSTNTAGRYCFVVLYDYSGKRKTELLHRLLAETFIENKDNLPQVNHIDGNKKNNALSNLEWCSPSYNSIHSYRNGLQKARSGSDNVLCKISKNEIKEMIKLYYRGGITHKEIAKVYKISTARISAIISRKARLLC